jgi:hypothetical protein
MGVRRLTLLWTEEEDDYIEQALLDMGDVTLAEEVDALLRSGEIDRALEIIDGWYDFNGDWF